MNILPAFGAKRISKVLDAFHKMQTELALGIHECEEAIAAEDAVIAEAYERKTDLRIVIGKATGALQFLSKFVGGGE